jgi:CDP-diacylglycerol--glycerol-3-phosphate 3-phosphatidyltransferase
MDAIDGALARQVGETKRGDFLDHIMDRYADIFIVCGISFGGYASLEIGIAAITGILVSSYIATQGQAVHMGRYYGGFGRADRLVLIIIVTFVNWMYLDEIYGLSVLGWSLLVLAVLSHSTGIYRFFYVWKRLE